MAPPIVWHSRVRQTTEALNSSYSPPIDVFGYGSLADAGDVRPATLPGYRRVWNIAMDNSRDLPGYKYYVDPKTGERPALLIAFLNLRVDRECNVNGALVEIDAGRLDALDRRERNYDRIEVGLAHVYIGTEEAEQRFAEGASRGVVVIVRSYYERVRESFRRLGDRELERFEASTEAPPCPIIDLTRVDTLA